MDGWARLSVALVWWYQGVFCKILGLDGDQRAIVAGLPGLPGGGLRPALVGIGVAELALGAWVLSGVRRRWAALAQTAVLVAFNAGGLAFGGGHIANPGQLLTGNAALLALAWLLVPVGEGQALPLQRGAAPPAHPTWTTRAAAATCAPPAPTGSNLPALTGRRLPALSGTLPAVLDSAALPARNGGGR